MKDVTNVFPFNIHQNIALLTPWLMLGSKKFNSEL